MGDSLGRALQAFLFGPLLGQVEELQIQFTLDCLLLQQIPLQCVRVDLHEFFLLLIDYMAANYAIKIFSTHS